MSKNLPCLNNERLDMIFKHVYDRSESISGQNMVEDRLADLLITLKSMQSFNFRHRPDDTSELFGLLDNIFNFERNSEGTNLWLSMMLAIKELYGFSDRKLVAVMKQISIRK